MESIQYRNVACTHKEVRNVQGNVEAIVRILKPPPSELEKRWAAEDAEKAARIEQDRKRREAYERKRAELQTLADEDEARRRKQEEQIRRENAKLKAIAEEELAKEETREAIEIHKSALRRERDALEGTGTP